MIVPHDSRCQPWHPPVGSQHHRYGIGDVGFTHGCRCAGSALIGLVKTWCYASGCTLRSRRPWLGGFGLPGLLQLPVIRVSTIGCIGHGGHAGWEAVCRSTGVLGSMALTIHDV